MKAHLIVFILSTLITNKVLAQDDVSMANGGIETRVDFIGGIDSLMSFLDLNLKYPEAALKADLEGIVFVEFVVNIDSTIVIRNAENKENRYDTLLTNEAKRVILLSNKMWQPAKYKGNGISSVCRIPITFELTNDHVYSKVDELPVFKRNVSLNEFINRKINKIISDSVKMNNDKVVVSFIIKRDGTISDVKVVNSVDQPLAIVNEIIRILYETSKQWKPAFKDRKEVNYNLILTLSLGIE